MLNSSDDYSDDSLFNTVSNHHSIRPRIALLEKNAVAASIGSTATISNGSSTATSNGRSTAASNGSTVTTSNGQH